MEKKVCNECNLEKPLDNFGKYKLSKDGFKNICKECRKNEAKVRYKKNNDYFKKYRVENKEKINKSVTEWRRKNPSKRKEFYVKNKNKELKYQKEYYNKNKEKIFNKLKEKYKTDIFYRLKIIIRVRISKKLNKQNLKKNDKLDNILGCSIINLKKHLENLFIDGMSWDNRKEWHIDHIIPLSSAKNIDEFYKLCHYTNLQPLWAEDNLKKSNKLI